MSDATLKHLASLSRSLNEASDLLATQLGAVEGAIGELRLGVSAWVVINSQKEIHQESDGARLELTHTVQFGYGKHNGKWGLQITSWYDEFDDETTAKRWFLREAPREMRLAAVDKLPELLQALAEEAAKLTEEAKSKAEQAKHIAAALGKKIG